MCMGGGGLDARASSSSTPQPLQQLQLHHSFIHSRNVLQGVNWRHRSNTNKKLPGSCPHQVAQGRLEHVQQGLKLAVPQRVRLRHVRHGILACIGSRRGWTRVVSGRRTVQCDIHGVKILKSSAWSVGWCPGGRQWGGALEAGRHASTFTERARQDDPPGNQASIRCHTSACPRSEHPPVRRSLRGWSRPSLEASALDTSS